jgi:5-hydroxyisourate hydrolase
MTDMARWSLHVLDTVRGRPAAGLHFALSRVAGGPVVEGETNADGRATGGEIPAGEYELVFEAGHYLVSQGMEEDTLFFDSIPVRFRVRAGQRYHVPLLLSAYGYTTYQGS